MTHQEGCLCPPFPPPLMAVLVLYNHLQFHAAYRIYSQEERKCVMTVKIQTNNFCESFSLAFIPGETENLYK